MHVAELWRYPVKSLAGEPIRATDLSTSGMQGDRLVHVQDQRGGIVTSRTRPKLLGLRGTLDDQGHALIDGRPWMDPARWMRSVQPPVMGLDWSDTRAWSGLMYCRS